MQLDDCYQNNFNYHSIWGDAQNVFEKLLACENNNFSAEDRHFHPRTRTMNTLVTLSLSNEKLHALKAYFAHNDWNWNDSVRRSDDAQDDDEDDQPSAPLIQPVVGEHECGDCFCTPCVTSDCNRQMWWPSTSSQPSVRNTKKRKHLYKKFWAMLSHRGAWIDSRYVTRNTRAVSIDKRQNRFIWQSHGYVREIMPNCVVRQVREWLPNLESQPYMGHLWE